MRVIDTRTSVAYEDRIKDADAPTDTGEQIAARAEELSRTIGNMPLYDLARNGDAFRAVTFDHPDHGVIVSINFPGSALPLWATPGGVHAFARHLNQLANVADQHNAARLQAALEQDCDRREEIQRLGHES